MFGHVRRARRHPFHPLTLEPLEDRLLLSVLASPAPASASGPNQSTLASVTPSNSTAAAPDAGGYAPGQSDTTPNTGQVMGPQPASASPAVAGTGASQSEYPPSAGQQASAAASASGYYANSGAQGSEAYSEYYPKGSTTSPKEATSNTSPATTAVLGAAPSVTAVPNALIAVSSQGPALLAPPPGVPAVAVTGPASPAEIHLPAHAEVIARAAFAPDAPGLTDNPEAAEGLALVSPAVDTGQLFPLALPLPGGLLPLDLAAWERGVRNLFSRLDALDDDAGEGANWERLTPWCAALGLLTVTLEIVRHRLSKRYPPGVTQTTGRGLAWQWPRKPKGHNLPEES
jgi:hypothetical protein